jgi:hypothetical protein
MDGRSESTPYGYVRQRAESVRPATDLVALQLCSIWPVTKCAVASGATSLGSLKPEYAMIS